MKYWETSLFESGSFRSYSCSVRSFRPDFRGESFPPSFKGGSLRPDLRGESFRPDLFILGKHKILGSVLPDFALIKPMKIMYLIVLMQLKKSFFGGKFRLLTAVNIHTSELINKQVSLYNLKLGTERTCDTAINPNWQSWRYSGINENQRSEGKQKNK